MTFVGVEADKRSRLGVDRLAAGGDLHPALEHGHPGVFLHLVVAHPLSGIEHEEDGPRLVA